MGLLSQKTGLPSFSSADSPIVNYFTDSGFERGTNGVIPSGWAQYNDGAVAVPVDGTGGSAISQVTMLVSNSSPIRGSFSAIISKDAANRQGVGYSFLFTISNVDKGVTAGVEFEMQTSANYASGDVVFYIYDVTNSILITPRAVSLPALPNFGRFISDYGLQTGTQYRFILHIATTNASAWTITLDSMTNSTTRTAVPGAPVGPTRSVTVTGSWTTNTTYTAFETQEGEWANYTVRVAVSGAPTATPLTINLPSGRTINTALLANTTVAAQSPLPNSACTILDASAAVYLGAVVVNSSSSVGAQWTDDDAVATRLFSVTNTAPMTWASGDTITMSFRVPIAEWAGSGTNFITDNLIESNARVRYYRNAAYSYTSATTFVWDAVDTTTYQTNGNWTNSSGEISVPATGLYQISTSIQASALLASDPQLEIWVSRQGGAYAQERVIDREAAAGYKSSGSAAIYLRLGDKFQVRLGSNATVVTGTINTFLEVFRVTDISARSSIGFGIANSSQYGHVAPRKGQTALTLSSLPAGWSTIRAVGIYYQDQDGNHRLKFNIVGTLTATSARIDIPLTGVVFKNIANYNPGCSAICVGTTPFLAAAQVSAASNRIEVFPNSSTTQVGVSGDVELDSKPSWA